MGFHPISQRIYQFAYRREADLFVFSFFFTGVYQISELHLWETVVVMILGWFDETQLRSSGTSRRCGIIQGFRRVFRLFSHVGLALCVCVCLLK